MSMRGTTQPAFPCPARSGIPPSWLSYFARRVALSQTLFTALLTFALSSAPISALDRRSQAICDDLGARILRDPSKFEMALEDALVAHEEHTFEIIRSAIDAVSAEPSRVRRIWRAAVSVLPHRRGEIDRATGGFAPPRAAAYRDPDPVIKRAELPGRGHRPAVVEIRRAEAPETNTAIEEIRRPELPVPQPEAAAKPATTTSHQTPRGRSGDRSQVSGR